MALRISAFTRHLQALTRRFVGQDATLWGWPGVELRFLDVKLPCSDEFALRQRDARQHHGRNGEEGKHCQFRERAFMMLLLKIRHILWRRTYTESRQGQGLFDDGQAVLR